MCYKMDDSDVDEYYYYSEVSEEEDYHSGNAASRVVWGLQDSCADLWDEHDVEAGVRRRVRAILRLGTSPLTTPATLEAAPATSRGALPPTVGCTLPPTVGCSGPTGLFGLAVDVVACSQPFEAHRLVRPIPEEVQLAVMKASFPTDRQQMMQVADLSGEISSNLSLILESVLVTESMQIGWFLRFTVVELGIIL